MQPVSELCELAVDCVNKTAPTVDYETDYKMIRTTNVKNGFIDLDEVRYVTEDVFNKWTRRSKPQYGDVILTREAPVGEVGRFTSNDDKVFLGQRLFHYRPNPDKLDWNFLAYVLQSPPVQGRFKGMGFGATVDHVRVGDAESLPVPCPPLGVQRSIGSTLSAYDDLIENNRRRIQLLEQAARLLYKEWFVHLRFPGHEHVKIKGGVPDGWEKKTAFEVMEVLSGGTPRTTIPAYWNGDIPFFTPKDAVDYAYVAVTEKTITEDGLKNCNSKLYPKDIVFITARGTVGKINLAQTDMAMNQSCYRVVKKLIRIEISTS
jgi:type I restriction enzyme S subunit